MAVTSGFIKISRALQSNWLWDEKPYSKGQAWIDMLLRANWKDSKIQCSGTIINVERGQLLKSEVALAKEWGWSRGRVRRFINVLKTEQMIVQQTVQGISVFSICNFEKYQSDGTGNGTANGTGVGTGVGTHKKKGKKNKEIKNYISDLDKTFEDFRKTRKALNKPLTERAELLVRKKLNELYPGNEQTQIECLEQSIENGWLTVYELKTKKHTSGVIF